MAVANVSAIKQYEGLKQIDDRRSSLGLANLLRLNILPTGYIYPKEERPTRDLLRKRLQLVRHRTSHVLSVKNILARNLGIRMKTYDIKKLKASEVSTLFADTEMRLAIMSSIGLIQHFQEEIDRIEKVLTKKFKVKEEFKKLLTVPGIGEILCLTIMLEVGHIDRFPTVGDYSSYCRCIRSIHTSNGKVTGYGVRGKKPSQEIIELARSRGIVLLATRLPMFESCGRLYAAGLKGTSEVPPGTARPGRRLRP